MNWGHEEQAAMISAMDWGGVPLTQHRTAPAQPAKPAATNEVPEPFRRILITDSEEADLPRPEFWWDQLLPAGEVTLLGAHGGMGKSSLALLVAICISTGISALGKPTRKGRVAFYSAEDPGNIVLWRAHNICRAIGVSPVELTGRFVIFDATESDPVLYAEVNDGGIRTGCATSAFTSLSSAAEGFEADVIVIDNASDAYDADENNRPRVRGFIRLLAQMVRPRQGAVLMLCHVDKIAARGFSSGQGYSGSTAWHNSVRSRLFLSEQEGRIVLEHQKSNLGRKSEPIELEWTDRGVLTLASNSTSGLIASADRDAILGLIEEFYQRGEFLSTSQNAPGGAYRALQGERGFPARLKRAEFFRILREAERAGQLARESYRSDGRKERERWKVI